MMSDNDNTQYQRDVEKELQQVVNERKTMEFEIDRQKELFSKELQEQELTNVGTYGAIVLKKKFKYKMKDFFEKIKIVLNL